MITQVEVFTPRVTTSPLPDAADGTEFSDPIQIRDIAGLGPVAATVNTTQYGSQDDEQYGGSNTGKRNIVLKVGLNPNWVDQTPESLRQILYSYFMPKNAVTLRFTSTHMATVEIEGIVETCDPNIFANDPEYQVSIICPKAAFVAISSTLVTGTTVALPDGDPMEIDYQGSAPTGFELEISKGGAAADMAAGEVRVLNDNPDSSVFIVTADVNATTDLQLGTERGNKYVRKLDTTTGVATSILGKQSAGSVWLTLDQGINKFRIAAAQAGLSWSLTYFARYGGL